MILHTPPYKAPIAGPVSGADLTFPARPITGITSARIRSPNWISRCSAFADQQDDFHPDRQDFLLPSFENDAEALREELQFGSGFVIVKRLARRRYSEEEGLHDLLGSRQHLGRPIPQEVQGGLLYSVRDEGYNLDRDFGAAGVRTSKTTAVSTTTRLASMLAGHNAGYRLPAGAADRQVRRRVRHHERQHRTQRDSRGASGVSGPALRPVPRGPARGAASR